MNANTTIFTRLLGDTPSKIVVNCLLIAALLYMFWRVVLEPLIVVIRNILDIFQRRELETIELIPPAQSQIDPAHSENMIAVIQRLNTRERLSLEVVG